MTTQSNNIYLQLGDIIQIDAPSNSELNQRRFLIEYIDNKKIKITSEDDDTYVLNIDDGNLSDESIQAISILSRPESSGYAKQKLFCLFLFCRKCLMRLLLLMNS